ncbi:MAG: FAD-dependent oxidoreductase [Phycisphaerales bacterium]|jgi:ribulose 1,5-bisphosphate synthetase/thiazole synthase|nr:FAD-dependent oxidoreductase [Phycisphaerales bacterium]
MTQRNTNRRELLKAAGLGAAAASILGSASVGRSAQPSRVKKSKLHGMKFDVLVVGGGPAGIGAALGAAGAGAKTMLIENHAFFGGVASWCLGMPINQMRPESKARSKVHELVINELTALGDQAVRIGQHQLWCNVEYLKVAVLNALDKVGCKYLVHTHAVDTVVKNNRVTGVVVATKQGMATIEAGAVVDCTGDGDIAFFAGAETMKEFGKLSPQTLCLSLTNVTSSQLRKVNMRQLAVKARTKYPLIPKGWGLRKVANSDNFYINHAGTRDIGQFDATDPFQRSAAECTSRRQIVQMAQAMREFGGDELNDIELTGAGAQMGVRETRRVKGLYVLTEKDAVDGRTFRDVIAWRSGYLDIGFVRFSKMKVHDVPYRAILPEKLDGLLMAGRCISATHVAASAGKSMGNCVATGHAAGLAAAMSVSKGILPREIKVARLQDALRADGVDLKRGGKVQKGVSAAG